MKHLLRLRTYVRPYWPQILASLLLLLCLTGLSLIVPEVIQRVLDIGLARRDIGYLIQSALVILGIGAARAVLSYFQRYLSEWVAQHIGYDLRNRLYDHIQHLSFTYHDHAQSGQLMAASKTCEQWSVFPARS
jgi:ATP-binding cassette subfamily B protein